MAFEAILNEVDQLHNVSTRLEGLAEHHPPVEEALITSVNTQKRPTMIRSKPANEE